MRRLAAVFGLVALAVAVPRAAAGDFGLTNDEAVRVLEAARADLFSFRLGAADRAFHRLGAMPSGAPAAYHHLALSAFLRAVVTDGEAHYELFFARTDTLEEALAAMPAGPWRDYLHAENDLRRAVAYGKQGRYLRTAMAARAAYGRFEDLVRSSPTFYEPYKGLGLLKVAIGSLPSGYRRFLGVLGYEGSVPGGLADLTLAERRSRYSADESAALLAVADALFRRPEAALDRLERLHRRYPESPFFGHLYGFVLLENRRSAEARSVLRRAAAYGEDGRHFPVVYVDFYLARTALYAHDYDEAAARYARYLERQDSDALRAVANVERGWALELAGRRDAAVAAYERVRIAREFDTDAAAKREAEARLRGSIDAETRNLLLANFAYHGGRYDEVERRLRPVLDDAAAPRDARAEAAFRLGRAAQAQAQHERALSAYERVVAIGGDGSSRWAPWSRYHAGEVLALLGRKEAARAAFEAALGHPAPYDFHQALEQSARVALTRLDG